MASVLEPKIPSYASKWKSNSLVDLNNYFGNRIYFSKNLKHLRDAAVVISKLYQLLTGVGKEWVSDWEDEGAKNWEG